MTAREILFNFIFNNKPLWIIAFANIFIYVVRYGVFNWAPTYLTAVKQSSDAAAFWQSSGFEVAAIPARAAFIRRGALRIELWEASGGATVPPQRREPNSDLLTGGTKHVAFRVTDLQGCLVRLQARGVDIAAVQRHPTEPMRVEEDPADPTRGPAFAAFIRDPGGTLVELLDTARVGD